MPTRNISLIREQDEFVEDLIRTGEYQNASEAVRDAIRTLRHRRQEDALRLKALKVRIEAGVAALERGDFIELDDAQLDSYLDELAAEEIEDVP
jgi:antitoxin ParD1/3/4